ncbi:PRC-barrel domain-containing protein [Solirubrobacter sp. CPCC 204708]|uniref:YsnF/AvaK domain-containing protein n=1 Tax=Solirubrobacter deserti TaxID=2282478 RepID=A0ABT4RK42_9ACTN|nr:PRC-barrel domain-containing protein [Solirubrobacter deserti]MBE2315776.1 PRC-barrel domain-containing protein [Solirubrobacter deserti]MDA0138887.1 YsnF/AvaK domain-containing protein [Solirubrobacter deserti]
MPDLDTVLAWRGKTVVDREGEKAGTLGALYLDENDRPAYAGVQTGLFKRRESMVPLDGARPLGDDVQVPYTVEEIHSAPHVDADVNLTDEEQDTLASHYGEPTQILSGDEGPEAEMVRSEEEVSFDVAPAKPRERVRLRKHTVVEHVEKTVPVRREEVRLEHEPPPDGKIVDVKDG